MRNETEILRDYELFLKHLLIKLNQFPRSQRYLLRQRVFDTALDVWENLQKAQYYKKSEFKRKYYDSAMINIAKLYDYLRLSCELGFLGLISIEAMSEQDKSEFRFKKRLASDSESLHIEPSRLENARKAYTKLTAELGKIESEIAQIRAKYAKI